MCQEGDCLNKMQQFSSAMGFFCHLLLLIGCLGGDLLGISCIKEGKEVM